MAFDTVIPTSKRIERLRYENPWWVTGAVQEVYQNMSRRLYFDLFYPFVKETNIKRAVVLMGSAPPLLLPPPIAPKPKTGLKTGLKPKPKPTPKPRHKTRRHVRLPHCDSNGTRNYISGSGITFVSKNYILTAYDPKTNKIECIMEDFERIKVSRDHEHNKALAKYAFDFAKSICSSVIGIDIDDSLRVERSDMMIPMNGQTARSAAIQNGWKPSPFNDYNVGGNFYYPVFVIRVPDQFIHYIMTTFKQKIDSMVDPSITYQREREQTFCKMTGTKWVPTIVRKEEFLMPQDSKGLGVYRGDLSGYQEKKSVFYKHVELFKNIVTQH